MEPEMNLGRYLSALRKWYRLILVAPLLAGIAALVVSFLTPPTYLAEADFAIVTDSSKVNFDPKFQTVSAADQLQQAIDQTARRKGLTTIAGSPDIAAAVIAKLGSQLNPSLRIPTNLLNSINTVNDGDLIKITAKANSPDKAALIANTWAQEYENRVNAAYGDNPLSPGEVQAQADATKQDYDAKEASLVAYVGNNPIDQLTRQVAEKQQIISSLQAGKNTAVKTIVDKELRSTFADHRRVSERPGARPSDCLYERTGRQDEARR